MTPWEKRTTVLVTEARRAIERGEISVPQGQSGLVELMSAPLTPLGLVDISKLSQVAISLGRGAGIVLDAREQLVDPRAAVSASASPEMVQCELFNLFAQLFAALTGVAVEHIRDFDEVRQRLLARASHEFQSFSRSFNSTADDLTAFYEAHGVGLFQYAKSLGGMKAVVGGQRQFTESVLNATRISGLYLDTQLIPDPVFPFFASDLCLKAKHLQLAHVLYYLLQLKPLVDARLPVPPVVVFPSFEEPLEANDTDTKAGIESLLLQVVAPVCKGSIHSVNDLFDYATKQSNQFLRAVMSEQLFVPQGHLPGDFSDARKALDAHFKSMQGRTATAVVEALRRAPPGVAVALAIQDRLRPQFHLQENAHELDAQPLMAIPVHWHYFQLCANASGRELVNARVLSDANFSTLKALQDPSVSWLADIPIDGLVELRSNMEFANFREELKKYTSQLAEAGSLELDSVVKEVNHALASLVQRHAKEMNEVKVKYQHVVDGVARAAVLGAGVGLCLTFLPTVALAVGVNAPLAAAVGALGGGAVGVIQGYGSAYSERRHLARHSLVGMLAAARATR